MSRDLALLDPEFRKRVEIILGRVNSETDAYQLRVFYTLRTPKEQAKLWRQSRSSEQIRNTVAMLRRHKANFLADTIYSVGPQHGRWATNAFPGQSWHQWGMAVDSFVVMDGRAVWNSRHAGYQRYAAIGKEEGCTCGAYWRRADAVHIQMTDEKVTQLHSWIEINDAMKDRFG